MHFVFSPPADAAAGLLDLPWTEPLRDWVDDRLTEIPQRGISRHVVRFVVEEGEVFALKELPERWARKEYMVLRRLKELGIPAVEVLGVAVDRPGELDAILVTRFLDYSSSFRALLANPRGAHLTDRLMDASKSFHESLDEKKVPHVFHVDSGGHTWPVWKNDLYLFAPMLFRDKK